VKKKKRARFHPGEVARELWDVGILETGRNIGLTGAGGFRAVTNSQPVVRIKRLPRGKIKFLAPEEAERSNDKG